MRYCFVIKKHCQNTYMVFFIKSFAARLRFTQLADNTTYVFPVKRWLQQKYFYLNIFLCFNLSSTLMNIPSLSLSFQYWFFISFFFPAVINSTAFVFLYFTDVDVTRGIYLFRFFYFNSLCKFSKIFSVNCIPIYIYCLDSRGVL